VFAEDKSEVEMIPTDLIRRNPENPRMIFDEAKMEILRESIHSVGILVPFIVYKDTEPGRYVLLDGERRWICAQNLNLPEVPANVIPTPTRLENILRMFNIHNVREAWTITETAWKLNSIIELVENKTGKRPTEKILITLTGLTISGIRRCKKLLSFPDEFQKMVQAGRIKSDFFIEMRSSIDGIKRKFPDIFEKKKERGIIEHFIDMLEDKPSRLENVTDFRFLKRTLDADKKGADIHRIRNAIDRLFQDKDITLPSLYNESVGSFYESFSLEKKCIDLARDLEPLDTRSIEKKDSLVEALRKLRKAIDQTLAGIEEG